MYSLYVMHSRGRVSRVSQGPLRRVYTFKARTRASETSWLTHTCLQSFQIFSFSGIQSKNRSFYSFNVKIPKHFFVSSVPVPLLLAFRLVLFRLSVHFITLTAPSTNQERIHTFASPNSTYSAPLLMAFDSRIKQFQHLDIIILVPLLRDILPHSTDFRCVICRIDCAIDQAHSSAVVAV